MPKSVNAMIYPSLVSKNTKPGRNRLGRDLGSARPEARPFPPRANA
jgi:hypothetical protein